MKYSTRPISDRTWFGSMGKEASRFSAKWSSTIALLGHEIDLLEGRDVVLEIDVRETDLRLDGELRANARPASRAVAVAFESKHGPLIYRCDRFTISWAHQGPEWQHNVRAIALKLEALRAVDRYGAEEVGQQYTGFKQLGAGRAMPSSHMTSDQARAVLVQLLGDFDGAAARGDTDQQLRRARALAHPDRHAGDRTLWDQVEQAGAVLGLAR